MAWHDFDKGGKWMIQHYGKSILWIGGVREVVAWRSLQAEVVQPGQLPDGLVEVQLAGRKKPDYFILELGTYPEKRLTEQIVRDLLLGFLDRRVLPEVVAVLLRPKGKYRVPAEVTLRSRLGWSRLQGGWRVVELWTLPAEELLAADDVGLIPWVPLTNFAGPPEPLLQQCRERIDRQAPADQRANLLAVAQVMARLRFGNSLLLTILGGSQIMIESILIQEIVAKGRQRDIVKVLTNRLGPVPQELIAALQTITEEAKLDELLDLALSCRDLEAFRVRLQSPDTQSS